MSHFKAKMCQIRFLVRLSVRWSLTLTKRRLHNAVAEVAFATHSIRCAGTETRHSNTVRRRLTKTRQNGVAHAAAVHDVLLVERVVSVEGGVVYWESVHRAVSPALQLQISHFRTSPNKIMWRKTQWWAYVKSSWAVKIFNSLTTPFLLPERRYVCILFPGARPCNKQTNKDITNKRTCRQKDRQTKTTNIQKLTTMKNIQNIKM